MGIGGKFYSLLKHLYSSTKSYKTTNLSLCTKSYKTSTNPRQCVGAYLFLIYINDLPSVIKSVIFLFADDAKIFRVKTYDPTLLQGDLASL